MRMNATMRGALAAMMAAAAAGCATFNAPWPPGAGEGAGAGADTCRRAAYERLVGMNAADIDLTTLPPGARILTPDMMVTQDYRAERLNVVVGADGRVGSLACY